MNDARLEYLVVVDEAGPRVADPLAKASHRVSLAAAITFAPGADRRSFIDSLLQLQDRHGVTRKTKARKVPAAFLDEFTDLVNCDGITPTIGYVRLYASDFWARFNDKWRKTYPPYEKYIRSLEKKHSINAEFSIPTPSAALWLDLLGGACASGVEFLARHEGHRVEHVTALLDRNSLPGQLRSWAVQMATGLLCDGVRINMERHPTPGSTGHVRVGSPVIVFDDEPSGTAFSKNYLAAADILASIALRALGWEPVNAKDASRLDALCQYHGGDILNDRTEDIATCYVGSEIHDIVTQSVLTRAQGNRESRDG